MLTFKRVISECAADLDFVREFDRLTNSSFLVEDDRPAIVKMVDDATGYTDQKDQKNVQKFIAFVYETVWSRLPLEAKDPREVVEPPPGGSLAELLADERAP